MKKNNLEFFDNGEMIAKSITLDGNNVLSETKYYSDIKLYADLERSIITGNIYSTQKLGDLLILKSDDGSVITLKNLKNIIILNKINDILIKSFNNIFNRLKKEDYECIYLAASHNRSNIDMLTNSPTLKKGSALFLEFELDSNGLLNERSKEELNIVCDTEFRNWVRIFFSNHKYNNLKICCDNKIIMSNSKPIIDLIKPKVDFMEGLYLKSLEKKEEEFYEQFNNGKTSKFM